MFQRLKQCDLSSAKIKKVDNDFVSVFRKLNSSGLKIIESANLRLQKLFGLNDMTIYTEKRKRRRAKAKLKNRKSVRRHMRKTGRTGSIFEKKNHSTKKRNLKVVFENPPMFFKPLSLKPIQK